MRSPQPDGDRWAKQIRRAQRLGEPLCPPLLQMRNSSSQTFLTLLTLILASTSWPFSACTPTVGEETQEPIAVESPSLQISDTATPDTPPSTPSADTEQAELLVSKEVYQLGEPVPITITNHLNRDIFYATTVFRIEDGKRIRLVETITEEEIPPRRLSAGESISGAWDQVRWWAPEKEGIERFIMWSEESQVPPGPYQWGLMYGLTKESAVFDPITIYSQVFLIEENVWRP